MVQFDPAQVTFPVKPGYSVVCVSKSQLGQCDVYYWVRDSLEGIAPDGTRVCWLAVVDGEEVSTPTCIEVFPPPTCQVVIASYGSIGSKALTFTWQVKQSDCFCAPWKTLYLLVE